MAQIKLTDTGIAIKLSIWEKIGSVHRDFFIPVTSVRGASAADAGWKRTLGLRIPGTYLPGLAVYGTYLRRSKDFVAWKRGQQVLQLNLSGKPYTRVFIGVHDAAALAEQINIEITAC